MKHLITLVLALCACTTISFAQGIEFEHTTLAEAIAKAKKENKIVFVDCYTTWCGPCKYLAKEIFTQKEVGEFYNKEFINLKMDCEKGEGPKIAAQYGVKAYPTLIFVDTNGKMVHKLVGGMPGDKLIEGGKNALDPNSHIDVMAAKYNKGERSLDFVLKYMDALDAAYDQTTCSVVAKELLGTMPIEKFANKEMFKVITNAGITYNSKEFNYLLINKDNLLSKIDSSAYSQTVGMSIQDYLSKFATTCSTLSDLNNAIETCDKQFPNPYKDYLKEKYTYSYYLANKQFDKWFEEKLAAADKEKGTERYVYAIHNIGDEVCQNPCFEGSKKYLDRALKLALNITDTEDGIIMGNFMLAKLYLKMGEKEKALKAFNIFFETNGKAGGNNTHRSVNNVKLAIDKL